MHTIRRHNLRRLIDSFAQGSVAAFSREYGITEGRLSQLLSTTFRDGQNFGEKMARKIEGACGIATFSLDQPPKGYEGEVSAVVRPVKRPKAESELGSSPARLKLPQISTLDIVNISIDPLGEGYKFESRLDSNYNKMVLGVRSDWLQNKGLTWRDVRCVEVANEGMEPSLYAGDFVIVNTSDTEPVDGAVFLFDYEGEIIVKRLTRDAGLWWLSSDNLDQRRFPRKAFHAPSVKIIGRVVRKESDHI